MNDFAREDHRLPLSAYQRGTWGKHVRRWNYELSIAQKKSEIELNLRGIRYLSTLR